MKFDRDGTPFVAVSALPAAGALVAGRWRLALALLTAPAAIGAFFRDPDRAADRGVLVDPDAVLAPADGKVMHVGNPQVGVAPPGEWQQISIFLSLADVHINRTPVGGRVVAVGHRPGRYLAAFRAESAQENEHSEIAVEFEVRGQLRTIVFRQIVGVAARRVVTRIGVGDELVAGQRIGLMRFGSRMDVFIPPEAQIEVELGDKTVAGETVIARWPSPDAVAQP